MLIDGLTRADRSDDSGSGITGKRGQAITGTAPISTLNGSADVALVAH